MLITLRGGVLSGQWITFENDVALLDQARLRQVGKAIRLWWSDVPEEAVSEVWEDSRELVTRLVHQSGFWS